MAANSRMLLDRQGVEERGGAMMSGALLSLGAALTITVAQATPVSVGELLADPDRFRDQPVTISGTMSNFRERVTHRGRTPYYTFDFGDSAQIVRVISYGKPRCQVGAAIVEGTFEQVKWRRRVNYSREEIRAWNVICFLGHEPKTK